MKSFLNSRFPYLDKLRFRLLHVFIILVFSVFFLLIFEPFNIKAWLKFPGWLKNLGLISLSITFSFIIAFSQLLVRTIIKIRDFKVWQLLAWLAGEVIILAVILTFIFADYTKGFFGELLITLKFTSTGLALPYSFSILILVLLDQKSKLSSKTSISDTELPDLIHVKDERDQVKFSVRRSYILYLESSDNYITIYYLSEGEIKKELIRNSMKEIEKQFSGLGMLRCHRSFMVNTENIEWIKKEGRNYLIRVKGIDTSIPVSRAYIPTVKSIFPA